MSGTDDRGAAPRFAFAFPGVGVGFCGRENEFFLANESQISPFLVEASHFAGTDLEAPLREGTAAGLDEMQSQIFTHAFDCAVAHVWRGRGVLPEVTAGYSLGVYAALVSAGAISYRTGIEITMRARELMLEACPEPVFDLAIVVGLTSSEIEQMLRGPAPGPVYGSLLLINSNNETSKVLSGLRIEIDAFCARAVEAGALKAVRLGVDLPYHNPRFLAGASVRLGSFLRTLDWSEPACPVVSSIDRRLLRDPDLLIDFTARNISTPIDWQEVVRTVAGLGIGTIVECGAGVSLTQNARLMPEAPRFLNIKNAGRKAGA